MNQNAGGRRRPRVSVTVAPELLRAVDTFVAEHPEWDRSKVVDEALARWYAAQQERAMEEQFAAPASAVEPEERAAWKRIQRAAAAPRLRVR